MKIIPCEYNTRICANCGNVAKHPYIGLVTSDMLDEDSEACLIQEQIDEGGGTIGYFILCNTSD